MEKNEYLQNFKEFGIKIYPIAILTVLTILTAGIVQLAIAILFLLSLKHIKNVNQKLEKKHLQKFRSRLYIAVVIDLVGFVVFMILTGILYFLFMQLMPISYPPSAHNLATLRLIFSFIFYVTIFAVGIGLVRTIFYIVAWKELNSFFIGNADSFPLTIAEKAIEGTRKLRKAYVLNLIGIIIASLVIIFISVLFPLIISFIQQSLEGTPYLPIFLLGLILFVIIPLIAAGVLAIVSFIFMILGYFDLSQLRNL